MMHDELLPGMIVENHQRFVVRPDQYPDGSYKLHHIGDHKTIIAGRWKVTKDVLLGLKPIWVASNVSSGGQPIPEINRFIFGTWADAFAWADALARAQVRYADEGLE